MTVVEETLAAVRRIAHRVAVPLGEHVDALRVQRLDRVERVGVLVEEQQAVATDRVEPLQRQSCRASRAARPPGEVGEADRSKGAHVSFRESDQGFLAVDLLQRLPEPGGGGDVPELIGAQAGADPNDLAPASENARDHVHVVRHGEPCA